MSEKPERVPTWKIVDRAIQLAYEKEEGGHTPCDEAHPGGVSQWCAECVANVLVYRLPRRAGGVSEGREHPHPILDRVHTATGIVLFAGHQYYPKGGPDDFLGWVRDLGHAQEVMDEYKTESSPADDWAIVVEPDMRTVVARGVRRDDEPWRWAEGDEWPKPR